MRVPVRHITAWKEDQLSVLNDILAKLSHAINNVEFGDVDNSENVWCDFIEVVSGSATEVCSASHGLKRVPVGTLVVSQDKAAILYKPAAVEHQDTSTTVFYQFDIATVSATLLLI